MQGKGRVKEMCQELVELRLPPGPRGQYRGEPRGVPGKGRIMRGKLQSCKPKIPRYRFLLRETGRSLWIRR